MNNADIAYRQKPKQLPIARGSLPFLLTAIFLFSSFALAGFYVTAYFMLGLAAFVMWFFRNPKRIAPDGDGLIISPADGKVIIVDEGSKSPITGEAAIKISIFMSVLNVHINRAPISGRVIKAVYRTGKFLVASLDKASEHNERNALLIEDEEGRSITVVQIAGLVARRIVSYVRDGDILKQGTRFGLIRFGSRLDVYVPKGSSIEVKLGQRTRAGETVLARFSSKS